MSGVKVLRQGRRIRLATGSLTVQPTGALIEVGDPQLAVPLPVAEVERRDQVMLTGRLRLCGSRLCEDRANLVRDRGSVVCPCREWITRPRHPRPRPCSRVCAVTCSSQSKIDGAGLSTGAMGQSSLNL